MRKFRIPYIPYRSLLLSTTVLNDIQCHNLSTPASGMMFCSSGRVGVSYEGHICGFTCNIGHELTGSDTRICQSDGSWSGTDSVCSRGMLVYHVLIKIFWLLTVYQNSYLSITN